MGERTTHEESSDVLVVGVQGCLSDQIVSKEGVRRECTQVIGRERRCSSQRSQANSKVEVKGSYRHAWQLSNAQQMRYEKCYYADSQVVMGNVAQPQGA